MLKKKIENACIASEIEENETVRLSEKKLDLKLLTVLCKGAEKQSQESHHLDKELVELQKEANLL